MKYLTILLTLILSCAGQVDDKNEAIKGEDGVCLEECQDGVKGAQGDKGDKGAQGDKGDKGAQGEQGEKGLQGQQGPQGPQGIGAKGDKGDKGADGSDGVCKTTSKSQIIKSGFSFTFFEGLDSHDLPIWACYREEKGYWYPYNFAMIDYQTGDLLISNMMSMSYEFMCVISN